MISSSWTVTVLHKLEPYSCYTVRRGSCEPPHKGHGVVYCWLQCRLPGERDRRNVRGLSPAASRILQMVISDVVEDLGLRSRLRSCSVVHSSGSSWNSRRRWTILEIPRGCAAVPHHTLNQKPFKHPQDLMTHFGYAQDGILEYCAVWYNSFNLFLNSMRYVTI